ncbi:MAG: hypothetical protein ACT4TC_10160 [Myxococcaceae bacterium]
MPTKKTKAADSKPRWELKQLVGTYALGPLKLGHESWLLRIEIFKRVTPKGKFEARVWREEFFRIQPTFPQEGGAPRQAPADELLTIEENLFMNIEGPSVKKTLGSVLERVQAHFGRVAL